MRDRADASIHCTSIIWSLHHSFNVFHVRRDVQAARGWRGCVVEPLGKLRGHEPRAMLSWRPRNVPTRNLLLSSLTYTYTRVRHVYPHLSVVSPRSLHLSYSLLILQLGVVLSIHHIALPLSSLSLSLSFTRSLAQTKETESRLQTGVALIKLLKRTCI